MNEIVYTDRVKYGRSFTGFFPKNGEPGVIRFAITDVPRMTDAMRVKVMRRVLEFAGYGDRFANATDEQLIGESKRRMGAYRYLTLEYFEQNGQPGLFYTTDGAVGSGSPAEWLLIAGNSLG